MIIEITAFLVKNKKMVLYIVMNAEMVTLLNMDGVIFAIRP